jgi:hypothetical protein
MLLMVQPEDFPLRVQASRSEKLKDLLDRFVGFSVRGFERGCRGTLGVRRVVEQLVPQNTLFETRQSETDLRLSKADFDYSRSTLSRRRSVHVLSHDRSVPFT